MLPPIWQQLAGPAARPSGHPALAAIVPGLVIGEYPVPGDAAWLGRVHDISAVVSLQDDADLARKGLDLSDLERAYELHGLQFTRIPIPDGDGAALIRELESAVDLVAGLIERGGRVYVHCNAGLNRAPTIAVAYLHVHHGHSLQAACALVKSKRPCVPYMRLLEDFYAPGGGRVR